MRWRWRPGVASLLLVLALTPAAGAGSLATLEGEVVELEVVPGEGEVPTLVAALATGEGSRRVALAPPDVLAEIGFAVEPGDRLRVRVFVEEAVGDAAAAEPPAAAVQKSLNLSRGTMVRLRSLHRVPLWDSTGAWQGGPARMRPGWRHGGHRPGGGGGPRSRR